MSKKKLMTFWEHIYELRKRVFVVFGVIVIFSILGYFLFSYIIDEVTAIIGEKLYAHDIAEGFLTRLRISFLIGFFFSIPLLLFELSLFIFPALNKREKRFMLLLLISTFILFTLGIFFALKSVLPISIEFLTSEVFFPENVDRLISYKNFISFFFQFLVGFGICFQFPVVLLFLMKIGALKVSFLITKFKYVVIIIFILAAVITPPDIVSQIMLAIPMIVLYTLCIIIGKIFKLGDLKE